MEGTPLAVGVRCELRSTGTGLRASLKRFGEVAYIGSVRGLPEGQWIGVRLDKPLGRNDGTVEGERYFECKPLHGAFVRREKLNLDGDFPVLQTQAQSIAHAMEEHRKDIEAKKRQQRAQEQDQTADDLVQGFWQQFTASEADVRKAVASFIDHKQNPVTSTVAAAQEIVPLDELVLRVSAMQEQASSAASLYLSPYDIRQTQLIVHKLLELIENTRTAFAPRKKFAFRARKTAESAKSAAEKPEVESVVPAEASTSNQTQHTDFDELVFANRSNEVIIVDSASFADSSKSERRDLNFSHLTNCVICVRMETSAIRGDDLKNCVIYTGPIWGSLWLENCHGCEFVVACRQLRVHHSDTTTFRLRINSHPIIEDCHQLQFGPYRLHYDGLNDQLTHVGLQQDKRMWAQVNDFKWHKTQQSPHWSLVDPKQPARPIPEPLQSLISIEY